MSILGIQVVPLSHKRFPPISHKTPDLFGQAEPEEPAKPRIQAIKRLVNVFPPENENHQLHLQKFSVGGPNHRKPNLRHETQINQRNLRFRPWEFYGWRRKPHINPAFTQGASKVMVPITKPVILSNVWNILGMLGKRRVGTHMRNHSGKLRDPLDLSLAFQNRLAGHPGHRNCFPSYAEFPPTSARPLFVFRFGGCFLWMSVMSGIWKKIRCIYLCMCIYIYVYIYIFTYVWFLNF